MSFSRDPGLPYSAFTQACRAFKPSELIPAIAQVLGSAWRTAVSRCCETSDAAVGIGCGRARFASLRQ